MKLNPDEIRVILATDCGSTTTKAIMIEKVGNEYRQTYRGEAPTTVETPFEDVTVGVVNAVTEIQEVSGRRLIDDNNQIIRPVQDKGDKKIGCDIYISTSSAGGGLQMMVAGVVRSMTAESAERAALGAGAIVMDVISLNDKRQPHERIERIRQLRPDMILIAGETDGAETDKVIKITETIAAADPRPRLGSGYNLPVIYAGNTLRRPNVQEILGHKTSLHIVDNVRPILEIENLHPAREEIHDLFLEHVMQQAPGYGKLMTWTDADIMPTPGAVGEILKRVADEQNINVVGVDIGGATTDVFSVFELDDVDVNNPDERTAFNRTVSANLGMSYSISNVLAEAGLDMVMRYVPFDMDERDLRNRVKNKMIRPTTIPQALEELVFEQAIAKEALRLAFVQHKNFATRLKGVQQQRTIADSFDQDGGVDTIVDMMKLDLLVGSGGVLSHAPRMEQTAYMLIDGFHPEGITRLAKDSIFMMPHLGVLSSVHSRAATEVFTKDCLVYLGTCIAPAGNGALGKLMMKYKVTLPGGEVEKGELRVGEMKLIPLGENEEADVALDPVRGFDVGKGSGVPVRTRIHGGSVGIIFDGRGRPLTIPEDTATRLKLIKDWISGLDIYPNLTLEG
jgi:uncharacterized protein (TIGR01319 family)